MSLKLLNFLLLIDGVDPEAIKEISRKTNLTTAVILIFVAVVFLIFVVYLICFQHKYKRPKRSVERYKSYQSTKSTITSIEKETYYVNLYERNVNVKTGSDFAYYTYAGESQNNNGGFPSLNGLSTKSDAEIEKIRYHVRYEFSIGNGDNLYSGEFFVYEESKKIKVGDTLEVKYDPNNPMINFTSYSAPVGM